jgi:hypothetical protein
MTDTKETKKTTAPEDLSTETKTPGVTPDEDAKSRKDEAGDLTKGTVRIVTEADILKDPRVAAAGAVVGQLYDFSNLPYVKDHALADEVAERNKKKDELAENAKEAAENVVYPRHTSEADRALIDSQTAAAADGVL